ncbi:hypothetical protein KEJ26_04265 [Candidatus Bathyarchaeota archaeon]|nr:hypothetical protein [Candidatus Bathyarchaeota archaeon]
MAVRKVFNELKVSIVKEDLKKNNRFLYTAIGKIDTGSTILQLKVKMIGRMRFNQWLKGFGKFSETHFTLDIEPTKGKRISIIEKQVEELARRIELRLWLILPGHAG